MNEQVGRTMNIAIGGLMLYGVVHLMMVDRLGVCMPWQAQAGRIFIGQKGSVVCKTPQYSIDLGK
jgi:hypothetical protein